MTFPPLDIFDPPQYNDNSNNATSQPRIFPPPITTATTTFPLPRRPQTSNNGSRSRKSSMTISPGRGGGGMAAAKRSDLPTEFCIPVELYLSPKASVGLRKPARKRSVDERPKHNSSRLSFGKGSSGAAQWRAATCRLVEEEEGCQLNVYVEETFLHQAVYIYLLKATDIRPADRSLFDRKDILVIHTVPGQRYAAVPTKEPLYLAFPSSESAYTWLTLLRSYAVPEVYGTMINPSEGGLYRMWRQVEVHCISARDLGQAKRIVDSRASEAKPPPPVSSELSLSSNGSDSNVSRASGTSDGSGDYDVWCEIWVNGLLCARTTVKRSTTSPEWHESFLIGDLPPFDNLQITLYKEKRGSNRSVPVGSVVIPLGTFRRGEYMEGWNPIAGTSTNASTGSGFYSHVGELRLKLKVDEEIVLPHYVYSGVLQMLKSRNYLDWMNDLGARLNLKDISTQFISVAVAMNALVDSICEMANKEVSETPLTHNTLFRGNTVLTKTVELFMAWYGKSFLEFSVGGVIRRISIERVSIEVDPSKIPQPSRDPDKNVDTLVQWCQELWDSIYRARSECPPEMRRIFEHIRKLVEKRCRATKTLPEDGSQNDFPWQTVSAFIFLRFIVPAILHPHLFGLVPSLPEAPVQRSLTLIAKVLQSSANLNSVSQCSPKDLPLLLALTFQHLSIYIPCFRRAIRPVALIAQQTTQKEQFMQGVRDFLVRSRQAMIDYILVISTSAPDKFPTPGSPDGSESDREKRLQVIESLRFRGANMPLLNREAIPLLPHLLDVPRHLAVISSAIVRRSNEVLAKHKANGTPVDPDLHEFVNKCLEIEQQALKRVSKLASHTREQRKRRATTSAGVVGSTASLQAPGGIVRPSTSGDSSSIAIRHRPSMAASLVTQRSGSSLRNEIRPSTATTRTDSRPTPGPVASTKRPSTTQGLMNTFEDIPRRPRSAGRTLSTPSTPNRGGSGKETFTPQGVTPTPDMEGGVKKAPKFIRPILKRPFTAPSPSLVPMIPPTPEVQKMPALNSRSMSQATGWSVMSFISTSKKEKEAKKWMPRLSTDDTARRSPPGSEKTVSSGGEKRRGFFRGLLTRK